MEGQAITPSSVLSSNETKHAYGYDPVGSFAAHNASELRSEVKDAECNIRHDIGQAECSINTNVLSSSGDIRREVAEQIGNAKFQLHDNIVQAERNTNNRFGLVDVAVLKAEYEAKLTAERVIKEVSTEVRHGFERVGDRLDAIDTRFTDKVCDVERRSGERFAALGKQLADCCCKMEIAHAVHAAEDRTAANAQQTGLLNAIVSALNVKNGNSDN